MQALEEAGLMENSAYRETRKSSGLVELPEEARPLDKGNWYILGRFWGGAENYIPQTSNRPPWSL
jgi:hypothetical protein